MYFLVFLNLFIWTTETNHLHLSTFSLFILVENENWTLATKVEREVRNYSNQSHVFSYFSIWVWIFILNQKSVFFLAFFLGLIIVKKQKNRQFYALLIFYVARRCIFRRNKCFQHHFRLGVGVGLIGSGMVLFYCHVSILWPRKKTQKAWAF